MATAWHGCAMLPDSNGAWLDGGEVARVSLSTDETKGKSAIQRDRYIAFAKTPCTIERAPTFSPCDPWTGLCSLSRAYRIISNIIRSGAVIACRHRDAETVDLRTAGIIHQLLLCTLMFCWASVFAIHVRFLLKTVVLTTSHQVLPLPVISAL
jgi:hypothetical protein